MQRETASIIFNSVYEGAANYVFRIKDIKKEKRSPNICLLVCEQKTLSFTKTGRTELSIQLQSFFHQQTFYVCTFDAVIEAIVCNAFWPIFAGSLVR